MFSCWCPRCAGGLIWQLLGTFAGRYKLGEQLHKSATCEVLTAVDLDAGADGAVVAVKIFDRVWCTLL